MRQESQFLSVKIKLQAIDSMTRFSAEPSDGTDVLKTYESNPSQLKT